ncbi:MAG: MTAP family purine nucleoside phosphorylase [Thermoplasmata archaeon]
MTAIGIIGGTGFKTWKELEDVKSVESTTPWGTPSSPLFNGSLHGTDVYLIMRHGEKKDIPAHMVNHRANIYALQRHTKKIIGVSSAGALIKEIQVPSISIPSDYVNLWNIISFFNESIMHVTPSLSNELRDKLLDCCDGSDVPVRDSDIYVQTVGPRLETKAEINVLGTMGDLVGMTMAAEATLSKEANLKYASITTVDNYANGIIDDKIDYQEIVSRAEHNWENATKILSCFIKRYGDE